MHKKTRASTPYPGVLSAAEPLLAVALLVYLAYEFFFSHVEGDQAYLLYAAQRIFAGVTLDGPHLIETNPPLIVWFNLLPAWMAQVLHVGPVLALRLFTLAMLAGSAAWSARILQRSLISQMFGKQNARLLWAVTFFFVVITRPAEFGQREQLLLALVLPYLLAAGSGVLELLTVRERIALGCAAGLGICFKPHHILTLAALEVFLAAYRRTWSRLWSPELLAAVSVGALYVAAVGLFTPAYLSTIMPLLQSTYWALGQYTFAAMVLHVGASFSLATVAGAAIWLAVRKRLACPMLTGAFLAAATGATLAYFVQHTGWYHQSFPAVALFEIAAVWLLAECIHANRPQWLRYRPISRVGYALIVLFGVVAGMGLMHRRSRGTHDTNTLTSELATYPQGTTVYAFSIGMNSFPVVLDHGLIWGSRFAHLWMLPAILQNEASENMNRQPSHALPKVRVEALADLQRSELTEDLYRTRPSVIFVERCDVQRPCDTLPPLFDAVGWFSRNPQFARIWSEYRLDKRLDSFDEYVRQTDSGTLTSHM